MRRYRKKRTVQNQNNGTGHPPLFYLQPAEIFIFTVRWTILLLLALPATIKFGRGRNRQRAGSKTQATTNNGQGVKKGVILFAAAAGCCISTPWY